MVKMLAKNDIAMQQSITELAASTNQRFDVLTHSVRHLEIQMSQISEVASRLEVRDSGKLPSQPEINPTHHVKAVTLRRGKHFKRAMLTS